MSSSTVILQNISRSQQIEVAGSICDGILRNQFLNTGLNDAFKDLYVSLDDKREVIPLVENLQNGITSTLSALCKPDTSSEQKFDLVTKNIANISQSVTPILKFVVNDCTTKIESAAKFGGSSKELKEDSKGELSVLPYLRLIDSFDFKEINIEVPHKLIVALVKLLNGSSEAVASLASSCLGSISGNVELTDEISMLWWNTIADMLQSSSAKSSKAYHKYAIAFKLWVRWVSRYDLKNDSYFQSLLTSDHYWIFLQQSLRETYGYDCKKYGLHILSKSVQSINVDITGSDLMSWKVVDSSRYLQEWSRYVSLIEILGIDTSLNQAEDSQRDILSILNTDKTLVPSSWGLTMLAVGLKSTMDSIRRVVVSLIVNMDAKNSIILTDPTFLEKRFLTVATIAPNYTVVEKGADVFCAYADSLADFIARIIRQASSESALQVTQSVLSFIRNNIRIHDSARIYLLMGLVNGLKDKHILNRDLLTQIQDIALIQKVESNLRDNAIYCFSIKLLLSADSKSIDFREWFAMVSSISVQTSWVMKHMSEEIWHKTNQWGEGSLETINVSKSHDYDPSLYLNIRLLHSAGRGSVENFTLEQLCLIIHNSKFSSNLERFVLGSEEFGRTFVNKANAAMLTAKGEPCDCFYESTCFLKERSQNLFQALKFPPVSMTFTGDLKGLLWAMQVLQATETAPGLMPLYEFIQYFRSTDILRLGDDRHERERTVSAYFNCLKDFTVSSEQEFQQILDEVLFYFPMTKKVSRLSMINCLVYLLDANNNASILKILIPELLGLWKVFIEERLSARERELHHRYMDLVYRKDIIESEFSESLFEISESIISQSFGRRSLLPYLAQLLYPYTGVEWVKEVFVKLYTFRRLRDNSYTIEEAISQMLDKVMNWETGTSYLEEYLWPEVSARALAVTHIANLEREDAAELFSNLLTSDQYKPFEILKRNNAAEKRVKIALFQIFTILERHVSDDILKAAVEQHFEPALDPESSLAVRVYLEWIIARRLSRDSVDSEYTQEKVFKPLEQFDGIPRIIVSKERIALLLLNVEKSQDLYGLFVSKYLTLLISLATSNKAGVRHSSVAMMHALRAELDIPGKEKYKEKVSVYLNILDGVVRTQRNHDNEKKFRKGTDTVWHLHDDLTLTGVCGDVIMKVLDECPVPPITRNDFITALKPFSTENIGLPIGYDSEDIWVPPSKEGADIMKHEIDDRTELSINVQTKSGAWMSFSDEDDAVSKRSSLSRGNMVVLASLVDKSPNLGGICRLCDVLGAELLCLNDLNVINKHDFKSVAMTADQWMPMMEVPIEGIIDYMKKKKREGYTLIGLEQTDNSIQLTSDLKFPEKCVLLLGREREGIPGNLLAELDFCVEIKQVGMVRSMNIQTATAVVVQAYCSQHC